MAEVVVVGGGMAGVAAARLLHKEGARVLLLEAAPRLGGKVRTVRQEGFLVEGGPDASVRYKPALLALAQEVGLEPVGTLPAKPSAFILRRGRPYPLPEGLMVFVPGDLRALARTPLLSPLGKLRALLEPFVPPSPKEDEALGEFIARRFGEEVFQALVAPLAGGVYGGEPEALSVRAAFPKLWEMEKKGGLLRNALRARKARGSREGGSLFFSFQEGLFELVKRTAEGLPVRLGSPVLGLEPLKGRFRLHLLGESLEAEAVVLATPAPVTAKLLRPFLPQATALLNAIPHVPSATVSLAFKEEAFPQVEGHGLLIAKGEGYRTRGFTWTDQKWAGRAPEGYRLVRTYFSGEVARLSEAELVRVALEDLNRFLGAQLRPERAYAFRFPEGMPVYGVGHLERVRRLEGMPMEGLFLAGNYLQGVGLPEVAESGQKAARRALEYLGLKRAAREGA
ncbi:protoporphyrinogen oxidase [Thermus filiformis]|uniref:Coproporphyrinogen III oxidase n=1 Tax=Thermus filiformis TaxID=276 RepID=A0A0A2WVG5_THEFI|nr:protoporphyrinogen oxidase [Thermus filiformis]KGQ22767.2 protoporphyrinogen oxidase [Thermus filiformis]